MVDNLQVALVLDPDEETVGVEPHLIGVLADVSGEPIGEARGERRAVEIPRVRLSAGGGQFKDFWKLRVR